MGTSKTINLNIDLKKLAGFTMGAVSETFIKIKQFNDQIREDAEEWKYVTFFTKNYTTYDLRVSDREKAISLIVAVSELA